MILGVDTEYLFTEVLVVVGTKTVRTYGGMRVGGDHLSRDPKVFLGENGTRTQTGWVRVRTG